MNLASSSLNLLARSAKLIVHAVNNRLKTNRFVCVVKLIALYQTRRQGIDTLAVDRESFHSGSGSGSRHLRLESCLKHYDFLKIYDPARTCKKPSAVTAQTHF